MSPTVDRCAALFEPAALHQARLEVEAALGLARAEAGLQSWALARLRQAGGRVESPASPDLLDTARLLQMRRAVVVIEAEVFASARCLLDLADGHPVALPARRCLAGWLESMLGRIEPLRRASAAAMQLAFDGSEAVAAILGRNLGLAVPPGGPGRLAAGQALRSELFLLRDAAAAILAELAPTEVPQPAVGCEPVIAVHAALVALRQALQRLGLDPRRWPAPLSRPSLDEAVAEQLLARWRHRLPHLQPQEHSHGDPRIPVD